MAAVLQRNSFILERHQAYLAGHVFVFFGFALFNYLSLSLFFLLAHELGYSTITKFFLFESLSSLTVKLTLLLLHLSRELPGHLRVSLIKLRHWRLNVLEHRKLVQVGHGLVDNVGDSPLINLLFIGLMFIFSLVHDRFLAELHELLSLLP